MSGNLVTVLTEAGSTVLLLAFGAYVVKGLTRRLDDVNARQQRLFDRMLKAWGLPADEVANGKPADGAE